MDGTMPTSDHIVKKGVLQRYSGREVVQHTAAVYILIATFLSLFCVRVSVTQSQVGVLSERKNGSS